MPLIIITLEHMVWAAAIIYLLNLILTIKDSIVMIKADTVIILRGNSNDTIERYLSYDWKQVMGFEKFVVYITKSTTLYLKIKSILSRIRRYL